MIQEVKFPIVKSVIDIPIPSRKITHIGIHHSASSWGDAETFNDWHRQRGFKDYRGDGRFVGYHFIIHNGTYYPKGFIELGRPIERTPAAHKPKNTSSIAICLVGNFSDEPANKPFDLRFRALAALCMRYVLTKGIVIFSGIYGHKELNDGKTECPGSNVDTNQMREYIKFYWDGDENRILNIEYNQNVYEWVEEKDRVAAVQRILNKYYVKRTKDKLVVDGILGKHTKRQWKLFFNGNYQDRWNGLIDSISNVQTHF